MCAVSTALKETGPEARQLIYCYSPGEELGKENHDILWFCKEKEAIYLFVYLRQGFSVL